MSVFLACRIYRKLCPNQDIPKPRFASLRTLYHPHDPNSVLDSRALVLYFLAPQTATGEDVLELHVHGGNAVVKSLLRAIPLAVVEENGRLDPHIIRHAQPGEFTRRAFYNDRLDLTQVEALGDTLSAETEQQRRIAVRGTSASTVQQYESWRQQLLTARGELEALIDFSEDQHFDDSPAKLIASVTEQVQLLQFQVQASIENAVRGELLRNGIQIALLGAPNVGKSSLLNRIVGRQAAIVSHQAGTTRDVIDVAIDIGGFYCRFGDLAGLRNQPSTTEIPFDSVEREGIRRAKERALKADVVIVVVPVERPHGDNASDVPRLSIDPEVAATLHLCDLKRQNVLYVINKIDLIGSDKHVSSMQDILQREISDDNLPPSLRPVLAVSCVSGTNRTQAFNGLQALLDSLINVFQQMTAATQLDAAAWGYSLGASERQQLLLKHCLTDLQDFLANVEEDRASQEPQTENVDVVLAAESLRSAADALAKITGKGEIASIEEVLGVVFEK
ncbi:MAG: hypothetical protein Q9220_006460 [cf. Caloplaca sp. 1 TL-2023]